MEAIELDHLNEYFICKNKTMLFNELSNAIQEML